MSTINHPETENILARLRRETAEIHQATENRMPFGEDGFALADYKRLLAAFYAFYESFEPPLESALQRHSIDLDYRQRRKTPKLEIDIQNLEMPSSAVSGMAAAEGGIRAFDTKEKIFGALYVVEGSTLGGQVISRILKQKFGLDESNGAAFFNGYGADTGAMWNAFRAAITKFAAADVDHAEIVSAAAVTFRQIGRVAGARADFQSKF